MAGEKREKLKTFPFPDHGFLPAISLNWKKEEMLFLNKISFNYNVGLDI